jgi:hypothetical protein
LDFGLTCFRPDIGGRTLGYYNTIAASYGLQVGGQKFGYALFFMTDFIAGVS